MIKNFQMIIQNKSFQNDMGDYVNYGSHIKLERLISYSFNKYFILNKVPSILESKKVDIVVSSKKIKIELKHNFEWDIIKRLNRELENLKHLSLEEIIDAGKKQSKVGKRGGKISPTYNILYQVTKDILDKRCDYLVWCISERDRESYFKKFSRDEICIGYNFEKYNPAYKIETVMDKFAKHLKKSRRVKIINHSIALRDSENSLKTNMHFYIYEFKN